jgi:type IV pilus biogenesis protein CpaD/CtpE
MATPEQLLIRNNVDLTDAQIERFISMLDKFLSINLRKILRELPTGRDRALNAASILSSIRDQLNRAGLSSEIAKIDEIYGAQLKSVKDAFDSGEEAGRALHRSRYEGDRADRQVR